MSGRIPLRIVVTLALASALLAVPAAGQAAAGGAGEISGRVIDSATREGLQGASVVVEPLDDASGATAVDERRIMATGADGGYRFTALPRRRFRVVVSRIGYIGATLEVDLREAGASRVSVGLENRPIELDPLEVVGGRPEPFGRLMGTSSGNAGNELIDRMSRERHLVSDTREMTHSQVVASVTLAETDLFRALQRIPGVSTRDDYTATMWTRGATWDQTRVYFDGLPLYNPTHAGWLFSAVNPDAIGSASFHPGYRSAQWGEGSAGVLDLQSRSGGDGERLRGLAEVSLASTRLALDGDIPGTGIDWMVAARRSYVDIISSLMEGFGGDQDLYIPYDFTDVSGRVDAALWGGWEVQASGIYEYDHLRGDIPGLLEGNRGRWGNRLSRVSLTGPIGGYRATATAGGTDFSTLILEAEGADEPEPGTTLPSLENSISHRMLSFQLEPEGDGPRSWAVGAQVVRDSVAYDGPFSLLGALALGPHDPNTTSPFEIYLNLGHAAAWGEKRWSAGPLDVLTGLRVEFGDSVWNGGTTRLAPRAALRFEPQPGFALSAGWTRNFQYMQDVAPAAGPIGPQLHLSAVWVLASSAASLPAVRTDIATVGIEHFWGDGWSVIGNLYERRSTGLKIPNPQPGVVNASRSPDAQATGEARGAELSLRRLTDRSTMSLGYAWGTSTLTSAPAFADELLLNFPSSADIQHSFDATALFRVAESFHLGGAFTYGSGVPFTELLIESIGPTQIGLPNAKRTPSYASLDLMVEYERRFSRWLLSGYLQLRNVTNRNNAVTYAGTYACPSAGSTLRSAASWSEVCEGKSGKVDRFEPGLPRLPLIGLRIAF